MIIYWLLFAYFALGAIFASGEAQPARPLNPPGGLFYLFGAIIIIVLVGLRYQVGADWQTYDFMYAHAGHVDFWGAVSIGDPGYQAVNWLAYHMGGDVWVVNLVCAVVFAWGLFRFCTVQADPWLALLTSIPYLVIVVVMGYTRQGVALGILMAGLAAFIRGGSPVRFAVYVVVAALFHRTAVVAFPLVALASDRNRFINLILALSVSVVLYDAFLGDAMDDFVERYIKTAYSSQGAAIRVIMSLAAAAVFWVFGRRLGFAEREHKLWRNFSLAALLMLVLLVAIPSSTAVDRMSIYVMPLQIAIFARIPSRFRSQLGAKAAVIGYFLAVQFVWMNFAQHSRYWIPYRFFPI